MKYLFLKRLLWGALFFYAIGASADQYTYPFVVPDAKFDRVTENVEVPNMPPVRSQDALGVCGPFTATTLAQHHLCQKNGWDCQNLRPEQQISDAGMSLASYDSDEKERIFSQAVDWSQAISSAQKAPLITNKCAPFDQIVNQSDDPFEATRLQQEMWDRVESARRAVNKELYENECGECGRSIAIAAMANEEKLGSLKLKQGVELEKLRAFTRETKERAVQQLLIPEECYTKDTLPQTQFPKRVSFPKDNVSSTEIIRQAKEWFKNKKSPLAFNVSFPKECNPGDPAHKCKSYHQFAIAGYRKACAPDGECVEMFKVHNSWGQKWQDMNNDGWLDIKQMFGVAAKEKSKFVFDGFE